MRIAIYNGNLEPPFFIDLLAKKLVNKNQVIFMVGTANRVSEYTIDGLIFVPTDSNKKHYLLFNLLSTGIRLILFNPTIFVRFLKILLKSKKNNKIKLKQFLIWSKLLLLKIDILHIQWASHLILFEEVLDHRKYKVIVSLRGRLINVSPYIDKKLKLNYQRNFPKIDGVHAVSKDILENLRKLKIDVKSSKVIYSGLELNSFPIKSDYSKKSNSSIELLSVGRHNWIKGYKYALLGIKILIDRGVGINYTIVGDGNIEEIVYLIDALGLQSHVKLIPKLSHENVLELMKESDLFLMPSVSEGLANVVIEAMAVGLPVLSSYVGGMKDLIKGGVNGFFFENRNSNDIAFSIEKFIDFDQEKLNLIVRQAKKDIVNNHEISHMCNEMIQFYNEV
jgi:colanic acid/amylovoran biosynthesis glycosyltransferase